MPKEGQIGARLTSGDVGLVFQWKGDRFHHQITRGKQTLTSAEHTDFETPVYQEVHQQGDLVFASGMSGDRHWSASIEAIEDGFLFDVACRCKTPLPAIGSAYQRAGGTGMHVIGKSIEDAAPPELRTVEETIAIESRPTTEPPATHRYRYAVVTQGRHWIKKDSSR